MASRKLAKHYNYIIQKTNVRRGLDERLTKLLLATKSKCIKATLKERNNLKNYLFDFEDKLGVYRHTEIKAWLEKSLNFIGKNLK